jgi:hypothetical protein
VNFALLLPMALTALFALALPLLIHLSRRSEHHITDFAALRWLSAKLRPRRKIIFQEILLLLLRLLLLAALALFLAQPVSMQHKAPAHWAVVIPGADITLAKAMLADKKVTWRWLAPNFPAIEKTTEKTLALVDVETSSLLRELDATLPANARITVFSPTHLSGLDGERVRLSRKLDWRVVQGTKNTAFENKTFGNPVANSVKMNLAIRYDQSHINSVRYFKAAHAAWKIQHRDLTLNTAAISQALAKEDDVLIWLSSGEVPEPIRNWISQGGTAFIAHDAIMKDVELNTVAWRSEQGKPLLMEAKFAQGRILQWQQALIPEAMPQLLEATFAQALKAVLLPEDAVPNRAFASSQIPLSGLSAWPESPSPWQPWLVMLIAAMFALERWLANASRRWSNA